MRLIRRLRWAATFTAALIAVTPVTAAHGTSTTAPKGAVGTSQPAPTADPPAEVVKGGKTQSVDPTKYNYVPEVTVQDALGTGVTSGFTYTQAGVTIKIPNGFIAHNLTGTGLKMTNQSANWEFALAGVPAQMCNYQWQFQNRFGSTIYSTVKSQVFTGCVYWGIPKWTYATDRTIRTGSMCARLFVAGTYRGEQCHNVYP